MSTIQQESKNQLGSSNNEIPDWFYFAFGMMLVIFSSFKPQQQYSNYDNSTPNEILIQEKEESTLNNSREDLKNVEVLLKSSKGEALFGKKLIQNSKFEFQYLLN